MHTLVKLFSVTAIILGLSGCVVAVGHDGDSDDREWDKTKKTQVNNQNFINLYFTFKLP